MFELTRAITANAGLPAYEVSNHARPGQESRHNLTYWRYRDYCGIGPGAHGRRDGMATLRHKKPENWLTAVAGQGHGIREETTLSPATRASEALLMGLRLSEGVSLPEIAERLGLDAGRLIDRDGCAMLERLGFVRRAGGRLLVTDQGMPVLDAVLGELVHPELVAA